MASDGLTWKESFVVTNDTTSTHNLALGSAGVIYLSCAGNDGDTGHVQYEYGWIYGRVYNGTDGWVTSSTYDFNQLYSAGNTITTAYTSASSYWAYMAVANSHVTTDDHQWGVTKIEYRNMPNCGFVWWHDEFCTANDTNTIGSGLSNKYGDLDSYPPYSWIGRGGGSEEGSTVTNTYLGLTFTGNSHSYYAPGSRIDHYVMDVG